MSDWIRQLASDIYIPIGFLLITGGLFFLAYSRFVQYKYFGHAIAILRGKYKNKDDPGQISAYQALSTALASTVGMGNIAGVAAAISLGGPGVLFWMWITAFVGMSSNFFTSTLALMYRGKDSNGAVQGGPMYVIREALPRIWRPLAYIFSLCAMIGCLPIFQANQLTQAIIDLSGISEETKQLSFRLFSFDISTVKFCIGIILTITSGFVIIGGIKRIGSWAGKMVPIMIVIYFGITFTVLLLNIRSLPEVFELIFTCAFTAEGYLGSPMLGGILGGLIVSGIQRASFSSEAGIGTAPMALGASKSREPIQEGLISMLSPAIDTLVVCTLTGFAILVTGVWKTSDMDGVSLTAHAVGTATSGIGKNLLFLCGFFFAITSIFSYSYYGNKAASFIAGVKVGQYYSYFYLITIVLGSIATMRDIISIIDIAYAIMAIPTVFSGIALAPKVMNEAKQYFARIRKGVKETNSETIDT